MNLIVDNQIVRTATGDDTPTLSEAWWNVSAFAGKKARLEVIDNTRSEDRGYILVDDIKFAAKMPIVYIRDGFMPPITVSQRRVLNHAIQHAIDNRVRETGYEGYGIQNDALIDATNKISWRMIQPDFDHMPGQSAQSLAQQIKVAADEVITKLGFEPNSILTQRLHAQAISDWVRTHFTFDDEWVKFNSTPEYWKLPYAERERHFGLAGILNMDVPKCVCAGFANSTVDLAKLLNIKCYKATGYQRWGMSFKDGWPKTATHIWVIFEWPDGFMVPADNSISSCPLEVARKMKGQCRHPVSLPLQTEEWGIFLAFQYSHDDLTPGLQQGKQDIYSLNAASFSDWQSWDISELGPTEVYYQCLDLAVFVQYLEIYTGAMAISSAAKRHFWPQAG